MSTGAPATYPPPPPRYEDLQAERDLKGSFAQLLKDHEEIQRLFKSVSAQLESTPQIGEDHALSREWEQLFKVNCRSYKRITILLKILVEAPKAVSRLAIERKPMRQLSEQYVVYCAPSLTIDTNLIRQIMEQSWCRYPKAL